jgi:mycofactocin glycosyltransferase
VPLPAGFRIAFDPGTVFVGADVLFGGSPPRLMRLNPAGVAALRELRAGPVGSPESGRLARRLTDAGLAHPRPPVSSAAVPTGSAAAPAVPAAAQAGSAAASVGPAAALAGVAAAGRVNATVVIPVRDRAAGLDRCLSALGNRYPVIVVDDGSVDPGATAAVCARHGAALLRRPRGGGPGPARADGLAVAMSALVAFLDSDCIAGPDWIEALAGHFTDPMVAAAAPRVRPVTGAGTAGRYLAARAPVDMGAQEARVLPLTRRSFVPTAALLVRRDAIPAAADWFDPELRFGEDVDLVWRLIGAGWRVRYDPAAEVSHQEPGNWPRLLGRRFRYGRSAAPLARRHPGQVPPLILQAWPAAAAAALLARRPLLALAAYGAGTGQLVRLLRQWGVPPRGAARPMAAAVLQAWLDTGRWSAQFALPALAAALVFPGGRDARVRAARRLALACLLAGPPVAEWLRTRPQLDLLRFTLGYVADEASYGAGVYRGALAERLAEPLVPTLAWRPLRRPRTGQDVVSAPTGLSTKS